MTAADIPAPRADARAWWGLAILALPCLLYSMDLTILTLAVPHIVADLGPSGPQLLWIVDIYGFVLAGALVTMGALGDRIGRRRLLLLGAVAFGAASTLAAFSTSTEMLIVSRALLGLAAATLAPSTLSLISNIFANPAERSFAIGVWIASFSVGGAIGPIVGGALLEFFWWGSVFLVPLPVMLLLLVLGPRLLPEFRDPHGAPIDLPSAAMSVLAILGSVYGLKHLVIGEAGTLALAALAGGLAFGVLFVRRQFRLPDPVIDVRLLGQGRFLVPLGIYFLGLFLTFGMLLLLAQHLQLVLGMSPLTAGMWSLFSALGFVVGSLLAPGLAAALSPKRVMVAALGLTAIGYAVVGIGLGNGQFVLLLIGMSLFSLGVSPVLALSTDLVISAAPPERSGSAAGVAETASELGGALGIAVAGSMVIGHYRQGVATELPAGLPAAADLAIRDNLGGAMDAIATLPAALQAGATLVAQQAYVAAFAQQTFIAAGLALAGAVLATRLRKA